MIKSCLTIVSNIWDENPCPWNIDKQTFQNFSQYLVITKQDIGEWYSTLQYKKLCTVLMHMCPTSKFDTIEYFRSELSQFMPIMMKNASKDIKKRGDKCDVVKLLPVLIYIQANLRDHVLLSEG